MLASIPIHSTSGWSGKLIEDVMTYAKILSIGDMTPYGAPMTVVRKSGEQEVIMLEIEQCHYWYARLDAIIEKIRKQEVRVAG